MKVLYIVTAYPRSSSDVITPWLVETIQRLGRRDVEVEVLAPSYRGLGSRTVDGVRVHRFRYAPSGWETLTHDQTAPDRIRERPLYTALVPSYLVSGALAAARVVRAGSFDVVHAFWPIPHGLLGLAASRAGGVPLVSTFFGVELSWLRSGLRVLRPVLRAIVSRSAVVTAISTYTASELKKTAGAADPVIVPFGATVDPEAFPAVPRSSQREVPSVLFAGRLVERKGVGYLLEAVRLLRDERRLEVNVVGDGPSRAGLEAEARRLGIAELVHFRGFVPSAELARYFADCDLFVLPAVIDAKGDTEGLGVVLIEALGYGKPVIASAVGGIPDIVRPDETGQLVPPGDPGALAAAMRRYLDDPALAARHAAAGREHVRNHFSWSAITDRLVEIYAELARQRGGGGRKSTADLAGARG